MTQEINTAFEGQPVACSKCGKPITLWVPVARKASVRIGSLPEWIVVPVLGFLTAVSLVIVMVGWWLVQPAAQVAPMSEPVLHNDLPVVSTGPAAPNKEPIADEDTQGPGPEPRADETPLLARRMPSRPIAPAPLFAEPIKPALDGPAAEKSAIPGKVDDPAPRNVVQPVEIPAREKPDLHYSLRRLRLDGRAPAPLRLAVTPAGHDDVGKVLTRMGDGYRFTKLPNQDLLSYAKLQQHDVVFLNCANLYAQDFQATLPLRRFVEQGGTLYASDLRGDLILAAFPEFRALVPTLPGVAQTVEAKVVDAGLQSYLGKKVIPVSFDAPFWRPAAFDASKVTVCLTGTYRNHLGQMQTAPLLVKFRVQNGTVIFTSFHHSQNDSLFEQKVLEYLVFASVSARSEARVRTLIQSHDFAANELRPALLAPGGKTSAIYQHVGGGLQIALGFENAGVRVKLTLRSPAGQTIEHEDQAIFLLEIPNAAPGAWQYTVTPMELPHANFPVVVAVGTRKV